MWAVPRDAAEQSGEGEDDRIARSAVHVERGRPFPERFHGGQHDATDVKDVFDGGAMRLGGVTREWSSAKKESPLVHNSTSDERP